MVVAALSTWHEQHEVAANPIAGVTTLPAHVVIEAYAVLTRLPGGLAVPAAQAALTLSRRFPNQPWGLARPERADVLRTLATAGVLGGATYDGLVGLEAQSNACRLLTLDQRAQSTYRRLGVAFEPV